tara:strand:- start:125 stop:454 length:330 start_codon:yes stop_codon:yes gene_type:complete
MIGVCFILTAGTGAVLRWLAINKWPGNYHGTIAINVIGSFTLGLLGSLTNPVLTILGTGGLGSLTTFSTFIADATETVNKQGKRSAFIYTATSLLLGIISAWLGLKVQI